MTMPAAPSTPTPPRRRSILNPFSPSSSSSPRGSSSLYHLVKPSTTLALIIGAVWISLLTRYSGEDSPVNIRIKPATMNMAQEAIAQHKFQASQRDDPLTIGRLPEEEEEKSVMQDENTVDDIDHNVADGAPQKQSDAPNDNNKNDDEDPFDKEYDNCIIGAGLSGSVIAEQYATKFGQTSLIIEKRPHIGGNCYDYIDDETGIRVSQYGAHLFHTRHERVWEYVQQFAEWVPYEHEVLGKVNGKIVPIPVTIDTVNTLFDLNIQTEQEFDEWMNNERVTLLDENGKPRDAKNSEEVALQNVGKRLYELIFKPYTKKQWDKYPIELGPEVLSRIPVRNNHDGRYFNDVHQALPKDGYTSIFENMLKSDKITVLTNTDFFEVRDKLKCKHRIYYSGQIDTYYSQLNWPKLEYRSLSFERVVQHDTPGYYQEAFVVNHPQATDTDGNEVDYTRIVEYKHLLNQTSDSTVYFIERSKDGGEPYYPVPNEENKELYKRYQEMASKEEGVSFVGRLANYKYFNMDDAILNALELFDRDTKDLKVKKEEEVVE